MLGSLRGRVRPLTLAHDAHDVSWASARCVLSLRVLASDARVSAAGLSASIAPTRDAVTSHGWLAIRDAETLYVHQQ